MSIYIPWAIGAHFTVKLVMPTIFFFLTISSFIQLNVLVIMNFVISRKKSESEHTIRDWWMKVSKCNQILSENIFIYEISICFDCEYLFCTYSDWLIDYLLRIIFCGIKWRGNIWHSIATIVICILYMLMRLH